MAILRHGGGQVCERIAAGIVIDKIAADPRIDSEKCRGTKRVLVARRDVEALDLLALILSGLVIRVRDLEPVARGEEVEVERIVRPGLEIEPVKEGLIVSNVMYRIELWS